MWRKISACVLSSVCFLSACDKSDNSSTATPAKPVQVPKDVARLTSAQLTSRTSLELKYVPLSLMVPDGWGINSLEVGAEGPRVFLHGPTPTDLDDVRVRVPTARTITDAQETLLEATATDTLAKHPELLGSSVVRDITGGKIIEQLVLRVLPPATEPIEGMPAPAVKLASTTQPTQTVQWTFTVVVPAGADFTAYALSVGMPLDTYKADNAFLRSILETLKYNPAAPSAPGH
jgi:hypothetical protein